jgi:hypothetical protein
VQLRPTFEIVVRLILKPIIYVILIGLLILIVKFFLVKAHNEEWRRFGKLQMVKKMPKEVPPPSQPKLKPAKKNAKQNK